MKIRSIALAAVAVLATSAAFAELPAPATKTAEPKPAPREQTLVEQIAADMREILRAVTPEIALPAVDVKLPTLDARPRG